MNNMRLQQLFFAVECQLVSLLITTLQLVLSTHVSLTIDPIVPIRYHGDILHAAKPNTPLLYS